MGAAVSGGRESIQDRIAALEASSCAFGWRHAPDAGAAEESIMGSHDRVPIRGEDDGCEVRGAR